MNVLINAIKSIQESSCVDSLKNAHKTNCKPGLLIQLCEMEVAPSKKRKQNKKFN